MTAPSKEALAAWGALPHKFQFNKVSCFQAAERAAVRRCAELSSISADIFRAEFPEHFEE